MSHEYQNFIAPKQLLEMVRYNVNIISALSSLSFDETSSKLEFNMSN